MNTVYSNVTQFSEYARTHGRGGSARGPLEECREMAVLRLGEVLHDGLVLAAGQFLHMVEQSTGRDINHLYMEAMELARDRAETIGESFRGHFLSGFNGKARRDGVRGPSGPGGELSLLDPDDLEVSLAAESLSNAIFNACSEELFGLDKRIGMLINDPDLIQGANPLGPETIGRAVMDALNGQRAPVKVRLMLAAQLGRFMPERVRDLYRDVNALLVARNILTTIRVGLKRGEPAPAVPASKPAAAAEEGEGLFGTLRRLLSGSLGGAAPIAGPALPGEPEAPVMPASPLIQTLSQIQHGRLDGVAMAGLDADSLADGRVNVLRELRGSGVAGMMNPLDSMTLDIVAMVFDYIFSDPRIPDAIKALLGRLQIPMLKVAMLDKSFFSHKNHPARRLLDGLAEAAVGWDPAEGHEGGLYRKVEELVAGVLEHFEDNLEVFETSLADLKAWLETENHEADRVAALSALTVGSRERSEVSRRIARDEVESCMLGRPVPGHIRTFLSGPWTDLLAVLYDKAGIDSVSWKGALATMNDLVWSVAPKVDPVARKRLVGMLPGLLKRLDEGVKYLGLAEAERNAFFARLVKTHAELVRAGKLAEGEMTPLPAAEPAEGVPVYEVLADFEPVEPVPATKASEAAAVLDTGAEPDAGALAFRELAGIKRGSWIAYTLENGEEVRAKLSWISPLKGIYLFTNRQGLRAMSINAEGLAAKLNSGEARLLDAPPLMDRAVDSMMEQLQRAA